MLVFTDWNSYVLSPCRWVPQTWSKLCRISAWPAEHNILPLQSNQLVLFGLPRPGCSLMSCKRTHCSKLWGSQQFEHSPIWNLSRLKRNIPFYSCGSPALHTFYFMIKLSYMNDLARNWKYRVRGIIYKLENKYIKPGLLHFWLLTFLWHFYKMTMLWLLSNLNFNGGFYRHCQGVTLVWMWWRLDPNVNFSTDMNYSGS